MAHMQLFSSAYFKHYMPYCLHQLGGSEHRYVYLPLNRYYKPLGVPGGWVKYEDYLEQALFFERDPKLLKNMWVHVGEVSNNPGKRILFFYNDWPDSKKGYLNRLNRVMSKGKFVKHFSRYHGIIRYREPGEPIIDLWSNSRVEVHPG